jgi:hypothetical protein
VFGASDDLLEFRGAIHDEVGAYDGTTAYVTKDGLVQRQCQDEDCPHEKRLMNSAKRTATKVEAVWCPKSPDASWLIKTNIAHESFDIIEDGELYCRGIVFALSDAATPCLG